METLLARASINRLTKAVAEEQGFSEYVLTDVKTNKKGEGFLGEILFVTVRDVNSDKRLELVVKSAFREEKVREMVPIRMSFENEIFFYTRVYPAFEKFEQDRGLSRVSLVPKCLQVCGKQLEEAVVLENLKASGFEIFDKKLVLDEDHVKLIFQSYGRFHGYSFALRDQKPEEYAEITKKLCNVYVEWLKSGTFADYLNENNKFVLSAFVPGEDDEVIEKYEKCSGQNLSDIFADIITKDPEHAAILHGDCWSNNMMFKYQADGKKPVDMRLIDLQLTKVGSPVCDLSYCLYSGASKEIFDNLNHYLQIYHDSFSSFVRELGSDPEKLFPFSVLLEHWKKYSKFGMIMGFSIIKMKLVDQEEVSDMTDANDTENFTDIMMKQKFDEEGYKKRIRGLLCHMSEFGAL